MSLRKLYEEIDQKATAAANSILLMDKLKNNSKFMSMMSAIKLPSDKYKAIVMFAELLGIPENRFADFVNQQENTRENV
jgi:hypothetical protein